MAATRGLGLYTPLYQVTAVVEPGPLEVSLNEAAQGWRFYFEVGPAAAGMAVHLAIGAGFGALFALVARALALRGLVAVAAGVAYGLVVGGLMGLVALPWAAGETAGGQVVADAPALLGWPVFTVEHVLYGLTLGLLAFRSAERNTPPRRPNSPSGKLCGSGPRRSRKGLPCRTRPTGGGRRASGRVLSTAQHAFQALEIISQNPRGIPIKALARKLNISLSSGYYLISSMREQGLAEVSPAGPGLYTLGPR